MKQRHDKLLYSIKGYPAYKKMRCNTVRMLVERADPSLNESLNYLSRANVANKWQGSPLPNG
jgi:hypothetical protein